MKRLVLLGGGHAHVGVLEVLARRKLPAAEVVVIAPYRRQVYSGMLPGWIAGHYPLDACMVPLDELAERSACRFLQTSGINIDTDGRWVLCADGSRTEYDLLSIDIGSTTDLSAINGAQDDALPVRPIENFILGWEQILRQAQERGATRLAVIGGGAAGVELALAMRHRLAGDLGNEAFTMHLVAAASRLLPDHPAGVGKRLEKACRVGNVTLHLGKKATAIEPGGIRLLSGELLGADHIIVATGASAPPWLWQTGISLDSGGFIEVDETLRSVSHPNIFAAGDTASMVGHLRPKSGVYAVRAGPPLAENLRRATLGQALVRHVPQKRALYLVSTGERHAVASWGGLHADGHWVWRWKDHIDRRFVERYRSFHGKYGCCRD